MGICGYHGSILMHDRAKVKREMLIFCKYLKFFLDFSPQYGTIAQNRRRGMGRAHRRTACGAPRMHTERLPVEDLEDLVDVVHILRGHGSGLGALTGSGEGPGLAADRPEGVLVSAFLLSKPVAMTVTRISSSNSSEYVAPKMMLASGLAASCTMLAAVSTSSRVSSESR